MTESAELVAIIAPMAEEIEVLRERVGAVEEIADGPRRYHRGRLQGVDVALFVSGEGKRNADHGIRHLVQKLGPTRILVLGLAGALSPKLEVGELLISSEVMEGESVLAWPDLQWLEEADLPHAFDLGRMVTVDEILSTPEAKSEWWGRTIRDQPAVADMESACFARVAISYKLPYLILRYVSDSADEGLPGFLEDCRAQDGRIDQRQVMWKAFWRPRTWPVLLRLRGRMKRAAIVLADTAEALVAALDRAEPAAETPDGSPS